MTKISVIVPVYNAEKYIEATLQSIADQTISDFDVHIVDDCSTDRSQEIIREFCHKNAKFFYHRSSQNFGGPAGPRNLGVACSTSEFIAFCDADDLWAPFKLEVQLAVAMRSSADIVTAVVRDFLDGETPLPFARPSSEVPVSTISHSKLLLKNWIALSSVLVKRKALQAAGPFNEDRSHIAVEDFDMWLRIAGQGGKIARVGFPLVHYRKLPTSISANKRMMIRKALNVIGSDYRRRNKGAFFNAVRPFHWALYVGTSAWMRAVRREL